MAKKPYVRLSLKGQSLDAVIQQLNTKFGANTLIKASKASGLELRFISTGVAALDLAIGGGIPENRLTELRGPFSSLKSTVCYHSIVSFQSKYPEGLVFFEDGEKSFDPGYAERLGCDLDRLVIINSDSGEQAVDVLTEVLDLGCAVLAVIDSIATLVPTSELESSMDQNFQGLHPRLINRMLRVLVGRMKRSMYDASADSTTVIATNQMREKIGVLYGDPNTSPGGKGREHYCSLMIKFLSAPSDKLMEKVTSNGIEREVRVGQKVRFQVTKNKVGGSQFEEGEFVFYTRAYKGHEPFTFNNEDELMRLGIYFGLIKRLPKSRYTYGPIINLDERLFKKALLGRPKLSKQLYDDLMEAIIKEQRVSLSDADNED